MNYPRIYLVLDNCFAIKRWIKPIEWMTIAKDLGFHYVQASTDNEIDPLFSTEDYMDDWFCEVKKAEQRTSLKVVNFYTGYQTYRTVGLAHHDKRIRDKIMNGWIKNLIVRIADLKAKGLGFSFFAVPHAVLQDPLKYGELLRSLYEQMARIAEFAYQNGRVQVSYEQMYAPHQPPFTINGTREFIKNIYAACMKPSYVTIDVGHMTGQGKFLMPSREKLTDAVLNNKPVWLGSDNAQQMFEEAAAAQSEIHRNHLIDEIMADIHEHEYLFSTLEDSDVYKWIEELACYSPIFHLQQTNGFASSHAAFTPENNRDGLIRGERLLCGIKKSYELNAEKSLQELVPEIFLSFEIFTSNTETKKEILTKLKQTIGYWREFVPEDGLPLNQLV